MLSVINMKFGNNNNNKVKKIYNKGDIILVRPQNMRYPYKIISIKEKKINIAQNIKILKIPNQKNLFTLNDICSISNFGHPYLISKNNQIINSTIRNNFNVDNYYNNKFKKNNSEIAIRKKIIEIEKKKQLLDKENIRQKNIEYNFFLKKKGLSYNNSKLLEKYINNKDNNSKIKINTNNKEENSKFFYYDSTLINNETNKKCYKLKYEQLTSGIIISDSNEKNLIFKRNFDNIKNIKQIRNNNERKNKLKEMKIFKSHKDLKLKRQKSSREGITSHEKIISKTKRPFSSENRKRNQRINFEIKNVNKKYKLEENKNFFDKKSKKKLKIQEGMRNTELNNGYFNYINELNNDKQQTVTKINKYIGFKARKNSDIFDYIIIPQKSEEIHANKENEKNKDFTQYKSVINK